jgi:hypothetical protein
LDNDQDMLDYVSVSQQPSAPFIHVWFLLVDSTNGQPYRGSSSDRISISSSAGVVDFRKGVKTEYKESNLLTDIASSQLVVYKNRAAFDANEASLKSSFPLHGLGTTEDDAIIVVVPNNALPIGDG